MRFEWDDEKDNLAEHRVSFRDARHLFFDPKRRTEPDCRYDDYGEMRERTIGLAKGLVLLVVAHTDRS